MMLSKPGLLGLIDAAMSAGYTVYGPAAGEAKVYLEELPGPGALTLEHVLTVNGPKDILLPRCEPLADFRVDEVDVVAAGEAPGKRLVLGTRPCDAASLVILDALLLEPVRDARYAARRAETVIVTVACSRADAACFCTSMGYGPHDETGSDVMLLPCGGSYLVRAVTPRGRSLLAELGVEPGGEGEPDAPPALQRTVNTEGLKRWLDGNFESPLWQRVSENCISCGVCYYLCPTCHCFDIVDEAGVARGRRYRIWDCCSFPGFTGMAGHQPRAGRHARYRQRIMHKFKYTVDNARLTACVGDGRCIRHCPSGVDIGEILESLSAGGIAGADPGRGLKGG